MTSQHRHYVYLCSHQAGAALKQATLNRSQILKVGAFRFFLVRLQLIRFASPCSPIRLLRFGGRKTSIRLPASIRFLKSVSTFFKQILTFSKGMLKGLNKPLLTIYKNEQIFQDKKKRLHIYIYTLNIAFHLKDKLNLILRPPVQYFFSPPSGPF